MKVKLINIRFLKFLNDWILVEYRPIKELMASGIILPEKRTDALEETGGIVKAGPGSYDRRSGEYEKVDFKSNQLIVFNQRAGSELEIGDKKYKLLKAINVLAVLKK